jgi:hypothetical protein
MTDSKWVSGINPKTETKRILKIHVPFCEPISEQQRRELSLRAVKYVYIHYLRQNGL